MIKKIKIHSINEWKESDNYILFQWYNNKEKYIKKLFDNNEMYKELNFERFDFDSTIITMVKFGYIFFDDNEFDYILEIIVDYNKILTGDSGKNQNDNIVIEEAEYKLKGKNKNDDIILTAVSSIITDEEITKDFLITLISEFKEKNEI